MKLAHLILAHQNPLQLERLAKRLANKDADVYIHLDKKKPVVDYLPIMLLTNVYFIHNRVAVTWANYSMMQATLNSMSEILETGIDYTHINLLSGADYPLKSAEEIQNFFFSHHELSFMRFKHIYNEWPESRSRFDKYSLGDYNIPMKFRIQSSLNRVLPVRKLPNGLEPYGFSQWMTVTPLCARYVIDYLQKHPKLIRFFRMTWGVDELVFQTILMNSHLKSMVVNDHKRYIKFQDRACSPETLTMADKEVLSSGDRFYARKFDPKTDTAILDYLDECAALDTMKRTDYKYPAQTA